MLLKLTPSLSDSGDLSGFLRKHATKQPLLPMDGGSSYQQTVSTKTSKFLDFALLVERCVMGGYFCGFQGARIWGLWNMSYFII